MNKIDQLSELLRVDVTVRQETAADFNLELTRAQFEDRMLKERNGLEMLRCLELLGPAVERLGLMYPYKRGGEWHVSIPRWRALVDHLHTVLTMRGLVVPGPDKPEWSINQDSCREKTSVGNLYTGLEAAQIAAGRCDRKLRVRAYKCQVCPYYHIGKAND